MDVEQLLRKPEFTKKAALAAIRGQALPDGLARQVMRLCVIRGIRYHEIFAEGPAKILRGARPEFTRALNARAIMSNRIPDMDPSRPEEFPYCIWHPECASEDAYRRLAKRYPSMAYQVGRACAAAGYTNLYLELDIVPEVSIAEEARAGGSTAIFDAIMAQPVKYKVMDDYARTIDRSSPRPAPLNGDTVVRPMLDAKQAFSEPGGIRDRDDPERQSNDFDLWGGSGFSEQKFNLTEDMNIDEEARECYRRSQPAPAWADPMLSLLTEPLPADLPAGNKDLLILMAAYNGDIDRYARLRRPALLRQEPYCLIRGIYHHPLFGLWFARTGQLDRIPNARQRDEIAAALHARRIMCNDLSGLPVLTPPDEQGHHSASKWRHLSRLPYLIWYPELAMRSTYRALAQRWPPMRKAVLRAAVFGDMQDVFDDVLAADPAACPDGFTLEEATHSPNPHYAEAIRRRAGELGVDLSMAASMERVGGFGDWMRRSLRADLRPSGYPLSINMLYDPITEEDVGGARENINNIYDGVGADASAVELYLGLPKEWMPPADDYVDQVDYVTWPKDWPQDWEKPDAKQRQK